MEKILSLFDRHRDQPTFVYYPMALPHWPFEATPKTPGWNPVQRWAMKIAPTALAAGIERHRSQRLFRE